MPMDAKELIKYLRAGSEGTITAVQDDVTESDLLGAIASLATSVKEQDKTIRQYLVYIENRLVDLRSYRRARRIAAYAFAERNGLIEELGFQAESPVEVEATRVTGRAITILEEAKAR